MQIDGCMRPHISFLVIFGVITRSLLAATGAMLFLLVAIQLSGHAADHMGEARPKYHVAAYEKIGSEYNLLCDSIYPQMLDRAIPSGGMPVDRNPPFLAYNPWKQEEEKIKSIISTVTGKRNQSKLHEQLIHTRLYTFELSQDPLSQKGVMRSPPIGWSFWNPGERLGKGTWHWRVRYMDGLGNKSDFANNAYQFKITGSEDVFEYPQASEVIAKIKASKCPRLICPSEYLDKIKSYINQSELGEIGKLIAGLKNKRYRPYNEMGLDEKYTCRAVKKNVEPIDNLIRAYLVTGSDEAKSVALSSFEKIYALQPTLCMPPTNFNKSNIWSPSTFAGSPIMKLVQNILDVFGDDLAPSFRKELVQRCVQGLLEGEDNYMVQVARSEYKIMDAHLWQISVNNGIMTALVLLPYQKDAEKWFSYFYDLWSFRAPPGSRKDGGWNEDFMYFDVYEYALTTTPLVLGYYSGVNFFDIPWYKNMSHYLMFAAHKGNPMTTFGDRTWVESIANGGYMPGLTSILSMVNPDDYWTQYRLFDSKINVRNGAVPGALKNDNNSWAMWWLAITKAKMNDATRTAAPLAPTRNMYAALFSDLGFVGVHSDMIDASKNMQIQFRSSTFGSPNHALPAQNAFNLSYGGNAIFTSTGHRHSQGLHNEFDFDNTRAHNAIVPDGLTQSSETDGFGWVPRFIHGDQYTYWVGDASHAYRNSRRPSADGTKGEDAKTTVNRFRRHMLVLPKNILIIYDELGADDSYEWQFKLHSLNEISKVAPNSIRAFNAHADVNVYFWASDRLKIEVTDKYSFPPVDVRGEMVNGKSPMFPNAWHMTAAPVEKKGKFRYLTIMKINPKDGRAGAIAPVQLDRVTFQIADYTIICHLDTNMEPMLRVVNTENTFGLSTGSASEWLNIKGKRYTATVLGETLFFEKASEKEYYFQAQDSLPDPLKYGNLYW